MPTDVEVSDPSALYRSVIGFRNQEYYLAYFRRADSRGYAPVTWHWPAFFIGFFWFLYRKQFRWAVVYVAFPFVILVIATLLGTLGLAAVVEPFYFAALVGFQLLYVPLYANAIYYRWARSEIEAARRRFPGQPGAQSRHLEARGGVIAQLPLLVFGILTVIFALMSGLSGMQG